MSDTQYTPEFNDEAVRQVVDRGHSVAEVAEGLGVSTHSLYAWIKALKPSKSEKQTQGLNVADIFNYIDMFHNPKRRHPDLGGVSPEAVEQDG